MPLPSFYSLIFLIFNAITASKCPLYKETSTDEEDKVLFIPSITWDSLHKGMDEKIQITGFLKKRNGILNTQDIKDQKSICQNNANDDDVVSLDYFEDYDSYKLPKSAYDFYIKDMHLTNPDHNARICHIYDYPATPIFCPENLFPGQKYFIKLAKQWSLKS